MARGRRRPLRMPSGALRARSTRRKRVEPSRPFQRQPRSRSGKAWLPPVSATGALDGHDVGEARLRDPTQEPRPKSRYRDAREQLTVELRVASRLERVRRAARESDRDAASRANRCRVRGIGEHYRGSPRAEDNARQQLDVELRSAWNVDIAVARRCSRAATKYAACDHDAMTTRTYVRSRAKLPSPAVHGVQRSAVAELAIIEPRQAAVP